MKSVILLLRLVLVVELDSGARPEERGERVRTCIMPSDPGITVMVTLAFSDGWRKTFLSGGSDPGLPGTPAGNRNTQYFLLAVCKPYINVHAHALRT